MTAKNYDASIYIGRFQPFHDAHLEVALKALEISDHLIFVIGGDLSPRTTKNPFTVEERKEIILSNFPTEIQNRIHTVSVRDYLYMDSIWAINLTYKVSKYLHSFTKVCLTGSMKDDSSYYLNMFPQWKQELHKNVRGINSTDIRKVWFNPLNGTRDIKNISEATREYLLKFSLQNRDIKDKLDNEISYIDNYQRPYKDLRHPVLFQTVDAVVFKSNHVLVIKRKNEPGKGLYALPGGFLNKNERLFDGSLRELDEETSIPMEKRELAKYLTEYKYFDHPERSLRGRIITHAFNFDLGIGNLLDVKAGDDAEEALWMPFHEVSMNLPRFFEDHAHIIEYFMYKQNKI